MLVRDFFWSIIFIKLRNILYISGLLSVDITKISLSLMYEGYIYWNDCVIHVIFFNLIIQ